MQTNLPSTVRAQYLALCLLGIFAPVVGLALAHGTLVVMLARASLLVKESEGGKPPQCQV